MKKTLLTVIAVCLCLPYSCAEDAKPFPVGSWHTTHEYFKRTASIPGERNEETDIDIDTKAESYQLTFKADGSGSGSGVAPDGSGRYNFGFTWKLTDEHITINYVGPTVVFWTEDISAEHILWVLDESSDSKMILSTEWSSLVDTEDGGWSEDCLYRYTFDKIVEE